MLSCKIISVITILVFTSVNKLIYKNINNEVKTTDLSFSTILPDYNNSDVKFMNETMIDENNIIKNISSHLDFNFTTDEIEVSTDSTTTFNVDFSYETSNTKTTQLEIESTTIMMENNLREINNFTNLEYQILTESNDTKYIVTRSTDECGIREHRPEKDFIVNGAEVNPLDWPWLALLYKLSTNGIQYKCVGSLISRDKVVTAAHCVVTSLPSQFIVFLGRFNTKLWGSNDESIAKEVLDIVIHSSYLNHKTKGADLAVLTLKYNTKYNYKIKPVCIFAHYNHQPYQQQGTVIGWGRTEHYELVSSEPRQVDLTIVNSAECIAYNNNFNFVLSNYKFCAANDTEGIGPCQGDSGGGFYVKRKTSENKVIWSLRGVVSGSLKLQDKDDCLDQKYFTFTDMEKQIGWMRDQIEVHKDVSTDAVDEISEEERQNKTRECVLGLSKTKENYIAENKRLASKLKNLKILTPILKSSQNNQVKSLQELNNMTALGYILKILTRIKENNNGTNLTQETIESFAYKLPNTNTLEILIRILNAEKLKGKGSLVYKIVSSIDIAKYLISSGADPYFITTEGDTPFLSAALFGHLKLLQFYIDTYHVNISMRNNNNDNALSYAARTGQLHIIKYLIESHNLDCNVADNKGFTPLHSAAIFGHFDIVKYLVEKCNANTNTRTKEGQTPLDLAATEGFYDIIYYLSDKTVGEYNIFDTPFHKAAFYGNLEAIKILLYKKTDVNIRDSHNQTALIWASKSGYLDVFKYLIEVGKANITLRDEHGYTVLHWSAFSGHLNILKYLVDKFNIDLLNRDNYGCTALHWAAEMGHLNVIKYLIREQKVDFDIENYKGETPLDFAKRSYRNKVVDWLEKYEERFYHF